MCEINKENATTEEQQLNFKQKIINDIINILAENKLSINDAKEILHATSRAMEKQTVKDSPFNETYMKPFRLGNKKLKKFTLQEFHKTPEYVYSYKTNIDGVTTYVKL